jgi:hypothetical protein
VNRASARRPVVGAMLSRIELAIWHLRVMIGNW